MATSAQKDANDQPKEGDETEIDLSFHRTNPNGLLDLTA